MAATSVGDMPSAWATTGGGTPASQSSRMSRFRSPRGAALSWASSGTRVSFMRARRRATASRCVVVTLPRLGQFEVSRSVGGEIGHHGSDDPVNPERPLSLFGFRPGDTRSRLSTSPHGSTSRSVRSRVRLANTRRTLRERTTAVWSISGTVDATPEHGGTLTQPIPDASRGVYGISVAVELVGTDAQNLRLYERRGLLEPARTGGGTRRYSRA
jgi:hypothetical protein